VAIALEKNVLYQDTYSMLRGFGVAAAASLVIGVIIIALITRKVVGPITVLEKCVTSKNFAENVAVTTKDEIGRLAGGFNELMQSLRGVLETSEEASQRIEDSSERIKEVMESIVNGSGQVEQSMGNIHNTLTEQYRRVNGSREELTHLDGRIQNYKTKFAEMAQTVETVNQKLAENIGHVHALEQTTASTAVLRTRCRSLSARRRF